MKMVVAIVTLIFYFSLSVVQAVNLHFCHGELESLDFTGIDSSCCASMHVDHSTCCKDITVEVDFDPDQLMVQTFSIQHNIFALIDLPFLLDRVPVSPIDISQSVAKIANKYPPPKVYLLQHSFLFYG
jgi:hypothetical protein